MIDSSLSGVQRHGMTDAGNALSLLGRGGGEQRPGAAEQDAPPPALFHPIQQKSGQHHRRTAAAFFLFCENEGFRRRLSLVRF